MNLQKNQLGRVMRSQSKRRVAVFWKVRPSVYDASSFADESLYIAHEPRKTLVFFAASAVSRKRSCCREENQQAQRKRAWIVRTVQQTTEIATTLWGILRTWGSHWGLHCGCQREMFVKTWDNGARVEKHVFNSENICLLVDVISTSLRGEQNQ